MKPRYNLRIQVNKPLNPSSNRTSPSAQVLNKSKVVSPTSIKKPSNRRQTLRLSSTLKKVKSRTIIREAPSKPSVDETSNHTINTNAENSSLTTDDHDSDNYDELLARHHRHMLEEQKDRKLYERYVRGQRTLRRLQCRRTHTAHLNEATRTRLLRELERERKHTVQDQICDYLADHSIVFRHGSHLNSNEPMNWSTLEGELPRQKHFDTVYQLDVMINNLKKVIRTTKSSISKPRLSVHERQKQRLAALALKPVISSNSNSVQANEISSALSSMNSQYHLSSISRSLCVRFSDDPLRTNSSQHLTCIQNVLSQTNHNQHSRMTTSEITPTISIRKQFLRTKPTHVNLSDSSQMRKRPLEKENCSLVTSSGNNPLHSNIVLRAASPMVSIKTSASFRAYPNTRKHQPMNVHSPTNRRQTRLSANV